MVASASTSTTHVSQPSHLPPPAANLLDYIYNALGAKNAHEREAHARWRAAAAAAAASAAPTGPSPSTSVASAYPSSSGSAGGSIESGYSGQFGNGTRKWTNHVANRTDLAVCGEEYNGLDNNQGQDPCYVSNKTTKLARFWTDLISHYNLD